MPSAQTTNLNDARSAATQRRLIEATISALVDIGFARTTGVEVCRRAEVTRGALNHHFPDFAELLIAALGAVYDQLLSNTEADADAPVLTRLVEVGYRNVTQPAFKAVIELWLAARNDTEFGQRLAAAISDESSRFDPSAVLGARGVALSEGQANLYRTINETLIGVGLGRAVSGEPMAHEQQVIDQLRSLAMQADEHQDVQERIT